jgi:hypothetical protein
VGALKAKGSKRSGDQGSDRSILSLVWPSLAASSALYFFSDNEADNDLWIHLLTGRDILAARALPGTDAWSFTTTGATWVDHEWLAQVLFAAVFAGAGDRGLWLLKLAVGLGTAWLVWMSIARHSSTPWVRAFVLMLVVAVSGRGFAIRPQIFTYLGTAALLAWLGRREQRLSPSAADAHSPSSGAGRQGGAEVLAVAASFILWANAHGGFVFGLGLLALYATLPPWPGWRRRAAFFLAAAAGSCVNPYGISLPIYIWHELQTPHPITEWLAAAPGDAAMLTYFLLIGLVVLTLPYARTLTRQPWRAALVTAVAVMSLRHQRHAPLLALCAAAPLAEQLERGLEGLRRRTAFALSAAAWRVLQAGVGLVIIAQMALMGLRLAADRFHVVYDAREYPVAALRHLRANGLNGNLALPLDWGGYVIWHGAPEIRVSLDGRFATLYPPSVVETNFAFFGGGSTAARLIDEYGATMVLAPTGSHTPAHARAQWHLRYRDEVAELLISAPEAPPPVIGRAVSGRLRFP